MKNQIIVLLTFLIPCLYGQQISQAEYFFDDDPGFGIATSISINPSEDIEIIENLDVSNLTTGFHTLHLRVKEENDNWSPVLSKAFFIEFNKGDIPVLSEIEYFYDQDPGFGNGIPFTDFQHHENLQLSFLSELNNLDPGTHEFYIRTKNDINQWSQTLSQQFQLVNCDLSISGHVYDESEVAISTGMLILYQYFGENSAVGVDTIYLLDGSYEFSEVCPSSSYFLKMIPENDNGFLPTYYGNTPYWQDASIVSTQQSSLSNINIIVSSFAQMEEGSSEVKGHIYHAESKGEPVKNIDVILEFDDDEKGTYMPVAYDRSDEGGEWSMTNLPVGNFRIKVEITGLEMDTTYYISIASENTLVEDLNFYVDFNSGIFIDHIGLPEIDLVSELNIYPNPVKGSKLWIELFSNEIKVQELIIYNYSGQIWGFENVIQQENVIDIGDLLSGFYIVKIETNKGVIIKRLIVL